MDAALLGKQVAHYLVVERLGQGGMGVVYKARDTHLDRFVALKVLPPDRVADPERKRRFVLEAKAASALNHPNIVHIYDISFTSTTSPTRTGSITSPWNWLRARR
jgi:eukaryotic-like serine/threonine-protein kinase